MRSCIVSVSTPRDPRAPAKEPQAPGANPEHQPGHTNPRTPTPHRKSGAGKPGAAPKPYRKSRYSEKAARCGSDRSVIVSQAAATSSTEGGSVNVVPSFWNSATRWTLPPPTMNTAAVSGTSSVHR